MILINGVPGRLVPCTGAFGVRPADFPVGDDGSSPLANDLPSLTDRAGAEWLWVLLTPLPGSGATLANDLGGYALTGAADGTYTQDYRGLVLALDGSVTVYEAEIAVNFGISASALTGALQLGDIVASGTLESLAPSALTGALQLGDIVASGSLRSGAEPTALDRYTIKARRRRLEIRA